MEKTLDTQDLRPYVVTMHTQAHPGKGEDRVGHKQGNVNDYFAIFDGHGGSGAAAAALVSFHDHADDGVEFLAAHLARILRSRIDGSTASLLSIPRSGLLYQFKCQVIGDSPVLFIYKDGTHKISPSHNLSNYLEAKAVEVRGGIVSGQVMMDSTGSWYLAMGRALGDARFQPGLSNRFEEFNQSCLKTELRSILMCSDGFLDHDDKKRINLVVKAIMTNPQITAEELVKGLRPERGYGDDVSVIHIAFDEP